MSSEEEKYSLPLAQNESDRGSSISSDLQEEYEELLRYAIVTPNIESSASQSSHPKGEVVPDVRAPTAVDSLHKQGENSELREMPVEVKKGSDFNISSHSKTEELSPALSPKKPSHPVMDFFSSHLLVDSSSPATNSSQAEAQEAVVNDFLLSDENLQKVENVLDLWSSGLKTNVLSELSKWKLNFIDWHRMEMRKEKEKHAALLKQLQNQINELKELQKTFEISIGRKDEVISSLSQGISKQKEKMELMRTFFHWQIGHIKSKQDVYEDKLADQYFQRNLLKKVWKGWRSIIQKQWKDVVERACQARAEEVCVQISNDFETKIAMLTGALENAKAEIQRMQHEKEHFEDSMKKAFMRGVCALNLEAMTMFQNKNDTESAQTKNSTCPIYTFQENAQESRLHGGQASRPRGIDFTNNKKEEYGPGVQGKEHPAHLDPSAPTMTLPVASPLLPSPPAAFGATTVPSATSMTSAGAATTSSVHVPVSLLVTGPATTATAIPEEMYVPRVVTSAQQKAGRTITARITGRCDFATKNRISSGLAIMGVSPPMSSVVVEKHHPVTVQTLPQATAAKYPRTIHPESNPSASRSVGTRSAHTPSLTSVQSIKVVD